MVFKLKFDKSKISYWANRYSYNDDKLESETGPTVRERGYFKYAELKTLCKWKAPRSVHHCENNKPDYVETVTRAALSSPNERFRIQALTVLDGVNWPTASVILHFGSNDPYPVLDFRALWSLTVPQPPQYKFPLWWDYTKFCRALADDSGVSMRTLDRALWQYSKENQK
ncbi:MAG: hypothetical protein O7D31_06340 [Alphaproteobacteria bacterium]|nr:hypothetical protein [Alphaproteobacteria bacterium]